MYLKHLVTPVGTQLDPRGKICKYRNTNTKRLLHIGGFFKEGPKCSNMAELNICRIFLKLTCLLDINTGYRESIRFTAWNMI